MPPRRGTFGVGVGPTGTSDSAAVVLGTPGSRRATDPRGTAEGRRVRRRAPAGPRVVGDRTVRSPDSRLNATQFPILTIPFTLVKKGMQRKSFWFALTLMMASPLEVGAQYTERDSTYKTFFVGSTLFMLANFVPDNNSPELVYLNFGYRVTGKDVISLELKSWKYGWPIGIPFGKSFEAEGERFPGYVRDKGISLTYQRFLRKGVFAKVDVMPAFQTFVHDSGNKIDDGFQIFNTYSIGYHVKLFKDRFFIQPSIAITHRPYQSGMPDSFKQVDDRWPKFFYGEPGFHIGYNLGGHRGRPGNAARILKKK